MKNSCYNHYNHCYSLTEMYDENYYHISEELQLKIGKKYKFNFEILDYLSISTCKECSNSIATNIFIGKNDESMFYLTGSYDLYNKKHKRNKVIFKIRKIDIFYNDILDLENRDIILLTGSDIKFT